MENDNATAPMKIGESIKTSATIGALAAALAKAQAEMPVAHKDATNPHFKNRYASFESIVAAWKQCGPKHGLALVQLPTSADGTMVSVTTILMHSSGESIASTITVRPSKADVQAMGSAISYAKRYSFAAVTGMPTGEGDDDGNAATGADRRYQNEPPPREQPRGNNGGAARAPEADRDEAFRMLDACKTMRDLDAAEVTIGELVPKGHPYRQLVGERVYATEDRIKAAPARAS